MHSILRVGKRADDANKAGFPSACPPKGDVTLTSVEFVPSKNPQLLRGKPTLDFLSDFPSDMVLLTNLPS